MKQCFYSCISLSVVLSGSVCGQSLTVPKETPDAETSISALVEDALANNPELGFYRAEISASKGEGKSASAFANPNAEFELGRKSAVTNALSATLQARSSRATFVDYTAGAAGFRLRLGGDVALRLVPLCSPLRPELHFPPPSHRPKPTRF